MQQRSTDDMPTTPAWETRWQKHHEGAVLPRHRATARTLHALGVVDPIIAGAMTTAAAHYEAELARCGGDAERVSATVRKLLLHAALRNA